MQGLGRPIVSSESRGHRLVAVGTEHYRSTAWLTFHDFLFDYIKIALSPDWFKAEIAKPQDTRHPLVTWYLNIRRYQRERISSSDRRIHSLPMTGATKAFLELAYDLYLCAHNAELPSLLLKRIRSGQQFEGALYEAFVIGIFARAGFTIEMEDESDAPRSHCEFVATHARPGRRFSVEAKAINSSAKRAGAKAAPPKIRGKLHDALSKDVEHERIIFIELSRAQTVLKNGEPDWAKDIGQEIAIAEQEITIHRVPAPPAYVFVTSRALMHALDSLECSEAGMAFGFKIHDFPPGRGAYSILEAVRSRDRHIELYWLLKSMECHSNIPITFDDRTPEETFSVQSVAPLRIGETYLIPDGTGREVPGVLWDAAVSGNEALCVHELQDGRYITCAVPLTDSELAAYRSFPDTFFGTIKEHSKPLRSPFDAFDLCFGTYSETPREKLLEYMNEWPEVALRDLPQPELAKIYSARMAEMIIADSLRRTGTRIQS